MELNREKQNGFEISKESVDKLFPKIEYEYERIPEEIMMRMNYKAPIEVIRHEMQMRVEKDVVTAVQQHDIYVEKNELRKALQYDRDQYVKGFVDGCGEREDKLIEQVRADTVRKMHHTILLEFSDCIEEETVSIGSLRSSIDQIAKEMLGRK